MKIALALILFLLALTSLIKSDLMIVWQLSIVATEFGHWLAIASLLSAAFALAFKPVTPAAWTAFGLSILGGILFMRPTAMAKQNEALWAGELENAFGISVPLPLMSFKTLLLGRPGKPVQPAEHIYKRVGEDILTFDFYSTDKKPAPWVLMVHGGGWDGGSKRQLAELNSHLASNGIAVVAITYRLAPKWKWPAQREDVLDAAAYIKAHAEELGLDPARWVLMGRSAGGQIAEAAAYQKTDPTLKGIIAYHAPADLNFAYKYAEDGDILDSKNLIKRFLGGAPTEIPEVYKDASPIEFAGKNSPPTLLLHGAHDPLTWNLQSKRLYEKMKPAGARVAYIEMPWATHAFDYTLNGPAGQIATNAVDVFLSAVLRS